MAECVKCEPARATLDRRCSFCAGLGRRLASSGSLAVASFGGTTLGRIRPGMADATRAGALVSSGHTADGAGLDVASGTDRRGAGAAPVIRLSGDRLSSWQWVLARSLPPT